MMKEIFKEIDGFNGDYYISNLGRVLSKKGKEENIKQIKKIIDTFRLIAYNISIKIKCEV